MDIFVRVPKKDNAMAENQKMEIDLGEDVAQGNYINLAIIAHSVSEFIIDFATVLPGVPKAKVKSRVILTPEHAKRLLLSLQENITRYESNVGKIEIPDFKPHRSWDLRPAENRRENGAAEPVFPVGWCGTGGCFAEAVKQEKAGREEADEGATAMPREFLQPGRQCRPRLKSRKEMFPSSF